MLDGLRLSASVDDSPVVVTVEAHGFPKVTFPLEIRAGEPQHLEVTRVPDSANARVTFTSPVVVQLRDEAGNPVSRGGVQVGVQLAGGGGSLSGTTSVETDRHGRATFPGLTVTGQPGQRTLRANAEGLVAGVSEPFMVGYAPFDSHLIIGAVKTISGVTPDSELFDVSFVFPLLIREGGKWPLLFSTAAIDLPLSAGQAAQVRGEEGEDDGAAASSTIRNASLALNVMMGGRPAPGARKSFFGGAAHVFDSQVFYGVHVGSYELPTSALHGSHLEIGRLWRSGDTPDLIKVNGRDVENPRAHEHWFASFLLRSDDAPLISVLNIRGMMIVPIGRKKTEMEMRIALSVPFKDLFSISSGH